MIFRVGNAYSGEIKGQGSLPTDNRIYDLCHCHTSFSKCSFLVNYISTRDKGLVSHQLLFTSGGEGRLIVGGEEFVQTKGSAFYLPPSVPHEYYPSNGNWITNWIVFRGEFAGQMLANLGFDSFRFSPEINTQKPAQLFERILVAAADPVNCGEKTSALVYEYILAMRTAMLFPDS